MPVFNEGQTLDEIIEAVLKQPLVAELICVDDCSQDDAAAVLEKYARCDPRVRVLKKTASVSSRRSLPKLPA